MKITKQREIKKLVLGLGYSGIRRQTPPVPAEAPGAGRISRGGAAGTVSGGVWLEPRGEGSGRALTGAFGRVSEIADVYSIKI